MRYSLLLLILMSLISITATQTTDDLSVEVSDQPLVDSKVTIDEVNYNKSGWMVIHNDIDGGPGEIIGVSPLFAGRNLDVVVFVDRTKVTDTLYAMLHEDRGELGRYEINQDFPVYVDGDSVSPDFRITEILQSTLEVSVDQDADTFVVNVSEVISAGPGIVVVRDEDDNEIERMFIPHGRSGPLIIESAREPTVVKLYSDQESRGTLDDNDFEVITIGLSSGSEQWVSLDLFPSTVGVLFVSLSRKKGKKQDINTNN